MSPITEHARPSEQDGNRTIFFRTLEQALSSAAPQGSTVHAIGFENTDVFLKLGYRVAECEADLVIARGGLREFDAARKAECKKLILMPTRSHACAASDLYRTQDEAFAVTVRGKKPYGAVFDPEHTASLASLFGEIAALDLAAFDVTFGAYMRGESIDRALISDVAELITELTSKLKDNEKDRQKAAGLLIAAGEKAARITEAHPELPYTSGAAQSVEALRMLFAAEDRPIGMRGETEMLLSVCVADFYIKSLTTVVPEFPPNNNKRIDSVCEYFHTDIRRACIHATAIYPPIKMRLCEYRRDEFRAEQMKLLSKLKQRQLAAMPVFKRLYPDDGFALKTLVDSADIGLCIALAPDVFAADTMLSFLKQTGRLEKYIV